MRFRHCQLRKRVNTNDDDQQYRQLKVAYQCYLCCENTASYGWGRDSNSTRGMEIGPRELQGTPKCVHDHGDFDSQLAASGGDPCPETAVEAAHRTRGWELFLSAVCSMITEPTHMLIGFLFKKYWGKTELERKKKEWEDRMAQLNQDKDQLQQDNVLLKQQKSQLEHDNSVWKLRKSDLEGLNSDLERRNNDLGQQITQLEEREKEKREKELQRMEQVIAQLKGEHERETLRMLIDRNRERALYREQIEREQWHVERLHRLLESMQR
ncbi:hypothetical protein EV426DRAFT_144172 [Tirmania nivea]|nr:hypothetical protein EV426DRAFT_144172 [Tirmania nivea]